MDAKQRKKEKAPPLKQLATNNERLEVSERGHLLLVAIYSHSSSSSSIDIHFTQS